MTAVAEFAHLPEDLRPVAALDAEARIAHIRAERWVQHAAADRVLSYLHEALEQPPRERMENILLVGESGMGKTMLVRKFERQTAVQFDDRAGMQRRPVVVMLMPHQPTEARFFDQLLTALNAPSAGHFVRCFPVQDPAVRLLRELRTRLVVIDELNSLLAGTPRQQRVFLQLLRFLSNELRLAFVGVGVPEARHALLSDTHCAADSPTSSCRRGRWARICATLSRGSPGVLPLREPSPVDSTKAAAPAVGPDRWNHARHLQGVRTRGGGGDPKWAESIDLSSFEDGKRSGGALPRRAGIQCRSARDHARHESA